MRKRFVGVSELSEYLSVKENTIYSWVNQRKIPHIKINGLVRFDLNRIDEWINERAIELNKFIK